MRTKRMRAASGIAVAGLACAVYAWSVIGAFAQPTAAGSAFATAYQYQYSTGHVTGGGSILSKSVQFDFEAKAHTSGIKGNCNVKEGKTNRVDCLTVTSLVVVGTHATFSGTARHNGVETTFTIDIDDLGEPGKGRDRFAITTGTGYSRSGELTSGNIQIHK
jgi:hypothetical protein